MEAWDLYSKDRVKLNQTTAKGLGIPEGCYRLVVHLSIFNKEGQLLIQKRQVDKSRWAGLWDLSVGGHVISGESSAQAAERETMEELGLAVSVKDKRPALTLSFGNGFDDMYILEMEVDIDRLKLQPEEVQEVRWADKEEVLGMIADESFIPYHPSLIELLFFLRNHSEAHTRID